MPESTLGNGKFVSVTPENFASFEVDSDIELKAEVKGELFRNAEISDFRVLASLRSNNMINNDRAAATTSSYFNRNAAGQNIDFKLPVAETQLGAKEGWYRAVYNLTISQKDGEWGNPVTLDQRDVIYKVGDPDDNIPYATVEKLSPCMVTVPAGTAITGAGSARFSVHDKPAGDKFHFKFMLQIMKPDGTEALKVVKTSAAPLKGGDSELVEAMLLLDGSETTDTGIWKSIATVEATNNDVVGAKPTVIQNIACEFRVVEAGASSSSSSSGTSSSSSTSSVSSSSSSSLSPSSSSSSSSSSPSSSSSSSSSSSGTSSSSSVPSSSSSSSSGTP